MQGAAPVPKQIADGCPRQRLAHALCANKCRFLRGKGSEPDGGLEDPSCRPVTGAQFSEQIMVEAQGGGGGGGGGWVTPLLWMAVGVVSFKFFGFVSPRFPSVLHSLRSARSAILVSLALWPPSTSCAGAAAAGMIDEVLHLHCPSGSVLGNAAVRVSLGGCVRAYCCAVPVRLWCRWASCLRAGQANSKRMGSRC